MYFTSLPSYSYFRRQHCSLPWYISLAFRITAGQCDCEAKLIVEIHLARFSKKKKNGVLTIPEIRLEVNTTDSSIIYRLKGSD